MSLLILGNFYEINIPGISKLWYKYSYKHWHFFSGLIWIWQSLQIRILELTVSPNTPLAKSLVADLRADDQLSSSSWSYLDECRCRNNYAEGRDFSTHSAARFHSGWWNSIYDSYQLSFYYLKLSPWIMLLNLKLAWCAYSISDTGTSKN